MSPLSDHVCDGRPQGRCIVGCAVEDFGTVSAAGDPTRLKQWLAGFASDLLTECDAGCPRLKEGSDLVLQALSLFKNFGSQDG